ncbi:MAG TPA: hypothetical protein VNL69_05755, partial [Bacteroidota bacterium]|nr:hypothetical protein [Bacteroidota bacterium]
MLRHVLLSVALVLAFFPSGYAEQDDLLIVIPAHQCIEATHVAPSPIRFYHRLSDGYLAGTTRECFVRLRKRGVDAVIVDDHPWSLPYAVVSRPHPGQTGLTLEG